MLYVSGGTGLSLLLLAVRATIPCSIASSPAESGSKSLTSRWKRFCPYPCP